MRLLLGLAFCIGVFSQPIRYTLSFPDAASNYVNVLARIPTAKRPQVEVMMAVWTPGSYLVREYARHVEGVIAKGRNGEPMHWEKVRKNRWRIDTGGDADVFLQYRVYSREMSVRTNWVERDFAMLNGAATFITLADEKEPRAHDVMFVLPQGWKGVYTGLPEIAGGAANRFRAADFDTLVDSPFVAGSPAVHEFIVDGKKHYLVDQGEDGVWDGNAAAEGAKKIVEAYRKMMGPFPYDKYVFFNMLVEAGGGLEHKNSTMLMASRWAWRNVTEPPDPSAPAAPRRPSRFSWLSLVGHEYFHLWNVKRLRPAELGPFDYENETYTRSLWIAEGFTSYYGPLTVKRAGLVNGQGYLRMLSGDIHTLQTAPGRLEQPLESSSYDAWIKYYRPDENSNNTGVSYYTKGAIVAWLLDAKIRKATDGAKSLDDLMRVAYERYGGARGYTPEEFRKTASEVAGKDLSSWFHQVVETTEELDYSEALEWFGLRFREMPSSKKAFLGLATRNDGGRLVVSSVRRGTPAFDAGINTDDEILAIDGFRVRVDGLNARLESYEPDNQVVFTLARRDRVMELPVTLGVEPTRGWTLETRPDATEEQKLRLKGWMGE